MPLDAQSQVIADLVHQPGSPDFSECTPEQAREIMRAMAPPPGPPTRIQDEQIEGAGGAIRLRLYYPEASGPLPAIVYYHGGGFVVGDLAGHDALCQSLAVETDCCVVSVDYRLAPEHKFPAATLDAYTALSWVHENADDIGVDHRRLAVAGDSAGGNLATVAARQSMERRGPQLRMQVLFYPVTDLRSLDTGSYGQYAQGHVLTRATMGWFRDHYLTDASQAADPSVSPLASDALAGLPPALVVTAECDVLRDEGEAYAEAMAAAGVKTTVRRYDGMLHGFVSFAGFIDGGKRALSESAAELRRALDVPDQG